MTEKRHIPGFVYKLMLLAATIIWGFAFVVMKDAVDVLPPAQLIGVRFFLTGLLMAAVFHRSLKGALNGPCLKAGLVLAVVTFLAFWVQTVGLADTTPGKNAFLTATYCVIVPFMLWAVAGKRPTFANVGAAALCITGIGLVSLTAGLARLRVRRCHDASVRRLLRGADHRHRALFEALRRARAHRVPVPLRRHCGTCRRALSPSRAPNLAALTPEFAFNLFYLVVFASGLCYLFQNVGLAHVSPAQGSLLLSLESVFGVLASVLFYGEVVTGRMAVGFVLIFAAILISELAPARAKSEKRLKAGESPDAPKSRSIPIVDEDDSDLVASS